MPSDRQIDFVLLFALPKELQAFLRHLGDYTTEVRDVTFHRATLHVAPGVSYSLIALGLAEMGNYRAATATTRAIDVWNPRFIILGGIAGGVKREGVQLGDLVVAEMIVAYEPGKLRPGQLEYRPRLLRPAGSLLDAARRLPPSAWALLPAVRRPDGGDARTVPKVHFGLVVSGEKVITSATWLRSLERELHAKLPDTALGIKAVEMEGYGTALAAYEAHSAPGFFLAKAICDWADTSKNDNWQEYAADVSASFIFALLQSQPVPVDVHKEQALRIDAKPYSGRSKLGLCKRMGSDWEDLADYFDIPLDERKRFRQGRECQDIWQWLENRKKLGGLPDALGAIDREDLLDELIPDT
jgi:nucleoside phosphorylase